MSTSNIKHSSASVEWYTPVAVIEAARACMGRIDLDPFSCQEAQNFVNARRFYTRSDDGFSLPWAGTVFCNPPGGKTKGHGGKGDAARAWAKLVTEWTERFVEQAIFIGFTLEVLQTAQQLVPEAMAPSNFNLCFPSSRLAYRCSDPGKKSPPHASVIVGLGMSGFNFRKHFSQFGACR